MSTAVRSALFWIKMLLVVMALPLALLGLGTFVFLFQEGASLPPIEKVQALSGGCGCTALAGACLSLTVERPYAATLLFGAGMMAGLIVSTIEFGLI